MRRQLRTWIVFGLALLAVTVAMGWVTMTVLQLDREQALSRHQDLVEENARLALWRIESAVTFLLAQESARPHWHYRSFYHENGEGRRGNPSPLLLQSVPFIRLHFQITSSGRLSAPQAPVDTETVVDLAGEAVRPRIENAVAERDRLAGILAAADLRGLLVEREKAGEGVASVLLGSPVWSLPAPVARQEEPQPQQARVQQLRNAVEFQRREEFSQRTIALNNPAQNLFLNEPDGVQPVVIPLWIGEDLLLCRRAVTGARETIQGCWLDWPALAGELLVLVRDLLPNARLEPAAGRRDGEHLLASLPVRLDLGEMQPSSSESGSWLPIFLVVAWCSVFVATAAVGLLLFGALSLSERRAAFVSAVTHELRTPLTTLQMYSEMLVEGMVSEESQRRRYLETLHAEAGRLGHLVENVLAYARLERGKPVTQMEVKPAGELLAGLTARLEQRAAQSEMELVIDVAGTANVLVRCDPAAVEQILFNLVDNACKYGGGGPRRTIEIQAVVGRVGALGDHDVVTLGVRDFGPGVAPAVLKRLFRPFSKSAHDAARSAPGVGLGLALSRRLARFMGGDLVLDRSVSDGARFVLELKRGTSVRQARKAAST